MRRPRPGQVAGFAIAPSIRDYFRSLGTAALILQDIEPQKSSKAVISYRCSVEVGLGLTGQPFWQDESYDRLVRNDTEFERIVHYIERNPVTAGLVGIPEEFPWSSARPIDNRPQVDNLPRISICHLPQKM